MTTQTSEQWRDDWHLKQKVMDQLPAEWMQQYHPTRDKREGFYEDTTDATNALSMLLDPNISPAEIRLMLNYGVVSQSQAGLGVVARQVVQRNQRSSTAGLLWVIWVITQNPAFPLLCLEDPGLTNILTIFSIRLAWVHLSIAYSYGERLLNVRYLGDIYRKYGGHDEIHRMLQRDLAAKNVEHYLIDYGKTVMTDSTHPCRDYGAEEWCTRHGMPWVLPLLLSPAPMPVKEG